ncbi:RNA-dependent RNA polymerase 1 [Magnaporthiopsis poae ATCC 64411]|uniref:RNA-dependent RNA polymerase 1 n=1 Tax=Magnaporthiopsis poae (strain ATCC 64411 / 73-15) TaxID=644358 RepID=A0A0C4DR39_MAGP6|nr:RNA-dependent RNA polymerase 1 [Magnaporthiopsis poae ATCC 64411]
MTINDVERHLAPPASGRRSRASQSSFGLTPLPSPTDTPPSRASPVPSSQSSHGGGTSLPQTPSGQIDPAWRIPSVSPTPRHVNPHIQGGRPDLSYGPPRQPGHPGARNGPLLPRRSANVQLCPPPENWKLFSSMSISLIRLPLDITTWDIWRALQSRVNLIMIDIIERRECCRARVKMEPPDLGNLPWADDGSLEIPYGKRRIFTTRVEIDPYGFYGGDSIASPLNRAVPSEVKLAPAVVRFGIMIAKTKMMIRAALRPLPAGNPFKLVVDFKRRCIKLQFSVALNETKGKATLRRIHEYKVEIRFSELSKLMRVDQDTDTCNLVIPLECPPVFYREVDNKQDTHNEERKLWTEYDTWWRQCNIMDDPRLMKETPLSLNEEHRQVIDLGRWTTYCIELSKGQWHPIEGYLGDFNIRTHTEVDFQFSAPEDDPVVMWKYLDRAADLDQDGHMLEILSDSDRINLPWEVRYQLEVCISRRHLLESSITVEFLQELSKMRPREARMVLEYPIDRRVKFYDPMRLLQETREIRYAPDVHPELLPEYCMMMRKAVVTPSTVYLTSPTVETTNRVLRHYYDLRDRFMRVQFTDELPRGRINATHDQRVNDELYTRVYRVLKNGIFIGDRHYQFLAFGNSQMRESSAYFFAPVGGVTCDSIRAWMGNFSHIRNVGKYAARLGQCFSTTRNINGTSLPWIKTIPDIEANGYCFSDGVGKISGLWSSVIASQLKLSTCPSAFQFRMGGRKGVLTVWPDLKNLEIHVRPSQEKFQTEHSRLEIIRCSQHSVATLNRQTIPILSALGIEDRVFEEMLADQLANYDKAMEDPIAAVSLLKLYVDENQMTYTLAQLIMAGLMKSQEPFVWTMMRLWRAWSIKSLKEKARIVVEKGAFVLGCVDETGKLRGHHAHVSTGPNQRPRLNHSELPQIFLQVPDGPDGIYKVITGTCVVGRNPSLHPGDLRVVEAVNVPELRHLRDVVVFPKTGDRDIPSMCSGGDLDGDDYFVFWDERLVPPPEERNCPPMCYTAENSKELDRDVTADDLRGFFVIYMKNHSLPTIAHAHLAQADCLGVKDRVCIELARLHSQAVDYPKTGILAVVPRGLMPKHYPHFMEKAKNRTYRSGKILGKLYDKVHQASFHPAYEMPFDARILNKYKLDADMLRKARQLKTKYDQAMRRIMGQADIETEFEVFSAFVLSRPRVGNAYKHQENVGRESATLKSLFRQKCIEAAAELAGGTKMSSSWLRQDVEALGPFVVAMYKITDEEIRIALHECKSRGAKPNPKSMPLISFPWIFDTVLVQIATSVGNKPPSSVEVAGDNEATTITTGLASANAVGSTPGPAAVTGPVTFGDLKQVELSSRLHDLDEEDIVEMDYVRFRDGRVVHRGVILDLFHADEDGYMEEHDPDFMPLPSGEDEIVDTPLIDVSEEKAEVPLLIDLADPSDNTPADSSEESDAGSSHGTVGRSDSDQEHGDVNLIQFSPERPHYPSFAPPPLRRPMRLPSRPRYNLDAPSPRRRQPTTPSSLNYDDDDDALVFDDAAATADDKQNSGGCSVGLGKLKVPVPSRSSVSDLSAALEATTVQTQAQEHKDKDKASMKEGSVNPALITHTQTAAEGGYGSTTTPNSEEQDDSDTDDRYFKRDVVVVKNTALSRLGSMFEDIDSE